MVKNLKWKLAAAVLVVLALFSALALYVLIPRMYNLSVSIDFSADKEAGRENPLIGYAPWANNESAASQSSLVYMDLTWAEWEPEEGKFLGGDGKGSTRSCVLSVTARKTRHIWIFRNGFMKELPTVFSMTWSMEKGMPQTMKTESLLTPMRRR